MNKFSCLLLVVAAFGCSSEKGSQEENERNIDFSYTVDTVMVDAGDEFIYVNRLLISSGVSQDANYLYNFDKTNLALQIIDLENLVLERILPFELEGPNGIGTEWISKVYETTDGNIILSDNYQVSVLDKQGNKSLGFAYNNHDFEGEKLTDNLRIDLNETASKDGKTILALYADQKLEESAHGIAVFDLENKQFRYKPMEIFKELDKYRVNLYLDGYPAGSMFALVSLQLKGDTLIYSHSAKNEVNFYNLENDSLSRKIYTSQYTSQQADGNYPNRAESQEQYQDILDIKLQEVTYGPLFFDVQNDVYWRFAKEKDRMKGDSVQFKTVLTAFDPQFNQLHEELLPSDFDLPYKYFARKGMIYTFLNIHDELAFVRLKPTFTYE